MLKTPDQGLLLSADSTEALRLRILSGERHEDDLDRALAGNGRKLPESAGRDGPARPTGRVGYRGRDARRCHRTVGRRIVDRPQVASARPPHADGAGRLIRLD